MPPPARWTDYSLCPLGNPSFLCDEMLRGLAGWLRVAGYDTTVPVSGTRDRMVLANAVAENRWLITRDRELTLHRDAPQFVICLDSNGLEANVRELTRRLNLNWRQAPFTRCKRCNTPLVDGPLSTNRSAATAGIFCHCPQCRQVFWEGSHVRRMREKLARFNRWRRPESGSNPVGPS